MSAYRPMRCPSLAYDRIDAPPPADLDAVWLGWHSAANKSEFVTSLDLRTAQALIDRILRDLPGGKRTSRARSQQGTE